MSRVAVFCLLAAVLVAGASAGESLFSKKRPLRFWRAARMTAPGTAARARAPNAERTRSLFFFSSFVSNQNRTKQTKQKQTAPSRKLLGGNANVSVTAPGANVKVAANKAAGVTAVDAPGTTVVATKDAVAVKAPANTKVAVDKKTGDVAVKAPGTAVVANKAAGVAAVSAPGTEVVSTPQGTAVNAPFTQVLTGAAAAGSGCRTVVRVPIVGLNFCGDRRRFFF